MKSQLGRITAQRKSARCHKRVERTADGSFDNKGHCRTDKRRFAARDGRHCALAIRNRSLTDKRRFVHVKLLRARHNTLVCDVHVGVEEDLRQIGRCIYKSHGRILNQSTWENTTACSGNGLIIVKITHDRLLKEVAHIGIVIRFRPNMEKTRIDVHIGRNEILRLRLHKRLIDGKGPCLGTIVRHLPRKTKNHGVV